MILRQRSIEVIKVFSASTYIRNGSELCTGLYINDLLVENRASFKYSLLIQTSIMVGIMNVTPYFYDVFPFCSLPIHTYITVVNYGTDCTLMISWQRIERPLSILYQYKQALGIGWLALVGIMNVTLYFYDVFPFCISNL